MCVPTHMHVLVLICPPWLKIELFSMLAMTLHHKPIDRCAVLHGAVMDGEIYFIDPRLGNLTAMRHLLSNWKEMDRSKTVDYRSITSCNVWNRVIFIEWAQAWSNYLNPKLQCCISYISSTKVWTHIQAVFSFVRTILVIICFLGILWAHNKVQTGTT